MHSKALSPAQAKLLLFDLENMEQMTEFSAKPLPGLLSI